MACGFTFLPSYYEALRPLPDDQRLIMYDAILDYALTGREPEGLPPILAGFFSLLRPNIDSSVKHYSTSVENGKKGGRPKKEPSGNPGETQEEPSGNREKEKEKEKECEKEKDKRADKPPRFLPPSVEQVRSYCRERGNRVDPQAFVDFYTSKGWKVGRETMKDWQASVRTWERRDGGPPEKRGPRKYHMETIDGEEVVIYDD